MAKCYKDAKTAYSNGKWKNKQDFIQYVWDMIIKNAKDRKGQYRNKIEDHDIVEDATKVFLNCYRINRTPVSGKQIRLETKFGHYRGHGLWPWRQVGVIERASGGMYSIPNDDFYYALLIVVLNISTPSRPET